MAVVGDILTSPEDGWRRYDNTDPTISYSSGWGSQSNVAYYNGANTYSNVKGSTARFNFTGRKIRYIGQKNQEKLTPIIIKIDGVIYTFSAHGSLANQIVLFEKTDLIDGEHFVEITVSADLEYQSFDAVDIDNEGVLKPYNEDIYQNIILLLSDDGKVKKINPFISNNPASEKMTSDNSPSGRAFASDFHYQYPPYFAFNQIDDSNNGWLVEGTTTGYIGYEFEMKKEIDEYSLRSPRSSQLNRMPKKWNLEGSDDGISWEVIDSQENQTWTNEYTDKTYSVKKPSLYKMYRLNILENNGNSRLCLNELKLFEATNKVVVEVGSQTEQNFINHGMTLEELSEMDFSTDFTEKHYIQNQSIPLGSGKVFEQPLTHVIKSVKVT